MSNRTRLTLCVKLLPIIVMLVSARPSRAVTWYVDPVYGSDTNSGLSLTEAVRTIDRSWNLASSEDVIKLKPGVYDSSTQGASWRIHIDANKSVTFEPVDPGDVVIIVPSNSTGILFDSYDSTQTVTFRNLTIQSSVSTELIRWQSYRSIGGVFDNCILSNGSRRVIQLDSDPSITRSAAFENCSITTSSDYPVWIENAGLFRMRNCTYEGTSAKWDSTALQITSSVGVIEIDGCNCHVNTHFIRPTRSIQANEIRITNNVISIKCLDSVYRAAVWFSNVPLIGKLSITGNTVTNEGGNIRAIVVDAPLNSGPPANPKFDRVVIANNLLKLLDPATSSYGIQIGVNVSEFNCMRNQVYDANFGILAQGRYGTVSQNLLVAKNPLVVFGGSQTRIQQNTAIAYGAESRALVLGRYLWFGADASKTSYGTDSVTITNNPDVTNARSALACGFRLMALTKASGSIQKFGWVSSIGPGPVVTVSIDQWYSDGGIPTSTPPADGTPFWIVTFPFSNIVTDNILDAVEGYYCITFDFNPDCGEDLIDYNCYQRGSVCLSNLDVYGMGRPILDLTTMRTKWATWSKVYPDNDKHSIQADPIYADAPGGNYRLHPDSPLIDNGSSMFLSTDVLDLDNDFDLSEFTPYDLDGNPRFVGVAVDIGAYEYAYLCGQGDLNCDGQVDHLDVTEMMSCANGPGVRVSSSCRQADLDADGDSDQVDFAILQRSLGSTPAP